MVAERDSTQISSWLEALGALSPISWAKAFDSVNIDSVLDALRRPGILAGFLQVVASLMREGSTRGTVAINPKIECKIQE